MNNIFIRKFLLLPILLCTCLGVNHSFSQTPKYSNEFLSFGVGARGLGMSGAFASVADDATAGFWNPSGLVKIEDNIQISLMYTDYFAGLAAYNFGAIAFNLDEKSALAFSFIRFGIDDIPDTSELIDVDGNFNYDRIRSFSAADNAFFISYARLLNDNLSLGVNTKIIRRTAGSF
ncbi:MAG: PorV/PorQ family protein, partial [Bacteroidota bacterium]